MARRKLAGARAILTGASSGIGRELAIQLAAANVQLVINARRGDILANLAKELSSSEAKVVPVVGDVCEPSVREQLLKTASTELGGLDCVINNAGIAAMGPFADATPERLRQIMEVNFFAPVELTRSALPMLVDGQDPCIVSIGSVLGHRAAPLKSEYCASKFAMHGFCDSLRAELTSAGIDVIQVSPSTTDSDFFDNAIEDQTDRQWKNSRATSPENVARAVIKAIVRRRHEVILTAGGKSLVWLDRLFPSLANRLVARYG